MRAGGGGGEGGLIGEGAWLFGREQPVHGREGTKGVGRGRRMVREVMVDGGATSAG